LRRSALALSALLALALPAGAEARTFVYVFDASTTEANDPKIYGFESRAGIVAPLPGSPFDIPDTFTRCTGQCETMEYVKKRKTLVVSGPTGLSSFLVNKDGSLAAVAGSPFGDAGPFTGLGAVQLGKRALVYSTEFDTGAIHGFEVGTDGVLTPITNSPFATELHSPGGLVARKRLLLVADSTTEPPVGDPLPNGFGVFVVGDDGTPVAAPDTPLVLPDADIVFTVGSDAAGKRAYLVDAGPKGGSFEILGFAIDKTTGAPTPIPGSPFDAAVPHDVASGLVVGKGIVAAAAFGGGDDDLALFRPAKDGSLAKLGSGQDSTADVRVLALAGKFLFAASPDDLQVLAVRKRDGAVAPAPPVPIGEGGTNPIAIVVVDR
jgi:hypothetical protein